MSVVIETTVGDITVDLYLSDRPRACLNFLKLCKIKYYNYNLFHTISRGFIAQTGDPTGSRKGGESFYGVLDGAEKRYFEGENEPRIKHTKMGLISFVGNDERMIGSQFFITLGEDLTYLDQKHCVFGEVVEGFDILEIINEVICDTDDRPYQDVRITHTVILDDPYPDPKRLKVPSRSPSPSAERLQGGRIAPDEDVDETEGKSAQEVAELQAEREAKARATILEMVGDLPDAEMAPPENVLFVCKLNPVTTDDDLEIIFNRFGKIVSCEVIRDRKTGDSLQYAFIEFADRKSCEDAYFKMDNILIDDRRIHVDFSQSVSKVIWHGKGRGVTHYDEDGRKTKLGNSDIGTGNYKIKHQYQKPKNQMGHKNDRKANNGSDVSNSDILKSSNRKHEKSRSKSPLEGSYNPNGLESRKNRDNKEKSLSSRLPSRKDSSFKRESRPTPSRGKKYRSQSRSLSPHRERQNRSRSRSPRRRIDDRRIDDRRIDDRRIDDRRVDDRRIDDRRERKSERYWDNSKREDFSRRRYDDSSRRNESRPFVKEPRHFSYNRSGHSSSNYPEREQKNERFGSSSNSHRNSWMLEKERFDNQKNWKEEKRSTTKYESKIKKSNNDKHESSKREIAEKEFNKKKGDSRCTSSDGISKHKKKKKRESTESDSSESEIEKSISKKKKKKKVSSDSSSEEETDKKKKKRKKSSDSSESDSSESESSESESSDSEDEKRKKRKKSKKRNKSSSESESSEDERKKYKKKKKKRKH